MGMVANAYYTAEMVKALPDDGNRYETVHGELLVTPAPTAGHQNIVRKLTRRVEDYLIEFPIGHPFNSPADVVLDENTLVQPDLFVVTIQQAETLDWERMKNLLLVVEVLSPSTAKDDRFAKRKAYQKHGIPSYWIVDTDSRSVDVWTPEDSVPSVCRKTVEWKPEGADEPLTIDLRELFQGL